MLRRVAFGIVLAFLFVLALLFTALNQQSFDVDIAFAEFEVSSGLALLIAFAAGLLAGAFARSRWARRVARRARPAAAGAATRRTRAWAALPP